MDFVAVTADGTPVNDLEASEVEIRLNGKRREIALLRLMRAAGDDVVAAPAAVPAPYGVSTGRASVAARRIIIAIDNDSFSAGTEAPMREAVDGLIARLSDRDRLLLVTVPYGGVVVPFTQDHTRIRTALAGISGQRAQTETGSEMACRTRRILETLESLLSSLGAGGTPTTVLFFTAGMAAPRRDAPAPRSPGMCELEARAFEEAGKAAARARAVFYVVHPGNMPRVSSTLGPGLLGSDNPVEGIEHLAGVTGGQRITLRAVGTDALTQVARETSAYYVAEIAATPQDVDGELRRVSVRVTRPGVVVRARPAIAFSRAQVQASRPSVRDLLSGAEQFDDLPMRVAGFTRRGRSGNVEVVGVADVAVPDASIATAAMALVDRDGAIVAQSTAVGATAFGLSAALSAPPGTYVLRVVASNTSGEYGTAEVPVVAELTQVGPLQLSALTLGLSRDGALIPRLEFGGESTAIASFEIYGVPSEGMLLSAGLEIARTADGPALVTNRLVLERGEGDKIVATGVLPIGALPPGDYVVRGRVGIDGGAAGTVMRTLRKR